MVKILLTLMTLMGGSLWARDAMAAELWGGEHIRALAFERSVAVELDCAHGEIDGPLVPTDPSGHFSVEGTFTPEHGGPVFLDEEPDTHPALYRGIIEEGLMQLTIILADSGREIGPFELVRGQEAQLFKCL